MSHKLTCRPFGFCFPSFLLMYTAYETLFRKKSARLAKKYNMNVCPLHERPGSMPRVQVHNVPEILLHPDIQEPECCINNKAKLWENNKTGHIAAKYLQTCE